MAAAKKKLDDPTAEVEIAEEPVEPPTPGDADYDWAQHYPKDAKLYVHRYPDGQTVALRRFSDITSKQWMMSVAHFLTAFDVENAAMERASCPEAITLIRLRPAPIDGPDDFQDLWDSWTRDSNGGEVAEPGE